MVRLFISSVQKEFAGFRKILKRYVTENPAYRRLFDAFVFEEDVVATDRLLVMSPGKEHPLDDASHLDQPHASFPVNPLIADVLYQTGHIERLGTGLEDLFKVCREADLPKPAIAVLHGGFHITVFRKTQVRFPRQESRQESMTLADWVLAVLLGSGKIVRTIPEKPNSRLQKYGVFP